jgi:hypothetical protein
LVGEVGSSFGVARTVDAVLWKNSDFFHEPKQRYEELLELGDPLLPLMADLEIDSWCFLVMARMVSFMDFARLSSSSYFASFPLISESPRQGWRRRIA